MSVQQLARFLADIVVTAQSKNGVAERGVISGASVVTDRGVYTYDAACPIDLYEGKTVWVQVAEDNTAVIIGD